MKNQPQHLDAFKKLVNIALITHFVLNIGICLVCMAFNILTPKVYTDIAIEKILPIQLFLQYKVIFPFDNLLQIYRIFVLVAVFGFSLWTISEKPYFRTLILFEMVFISLAKCIQSANFFFPKMFPIVDSWMRFLISYRTGFLIILTPLFLFVVALRLVKDFYQKRKENKASL